MQLFVPILSLVATQLAVGFVLSVFYRSNRNIEAAKWWALCLFSISVAWILSLARVLLPDWISVVFANAFYMLSAFYILIGTRVYFNSPPRIHQALLPILMVMILTMFFYWVYDLIVVRIVLISFSGAIYLIAALAYFFRAFQANAAFIGAIVSLGLVVVSLFLYGGLTAFYAPSPSEFFAFPGNLGLVVLQPGGTIGFGLFGLLLLMLRLNAELKLLTQTDGLTQTYNRQGFIEVASDSFDVAKKAQTPLALMYLQINAFKLINERWGHEVADEVLVDTVRKIRLELRAEDLLCRYAGVQFLILQPGKSEADLEKLSNRIRLRLSENPIYLKGLDVVITYSSGNSEIHPGDKDIEDMIGRAGEQLSKAIKLGRRPEASLSA